jgi:hypothetical protein
VDSDSSSDGLQVIRDNVVVRLVVYYILVYSFFVALEGLFPSIVDYMNIERLRELAGTQGTFGNAEQIDIPLEALRGTDDMLRPERSIPVLISMLGALALALPVAWVYTWTRPYNKTGQAVAQALIILPIAIALVVFLVKGSLALAFSLAGIVAAVRFRTSLSDTGDAVFLFVVIGIGLSAGVQLLSVSFIASLFFNGVALAVWRTQFAARPSRLVGLQLQRAGPVDQGALPDGPSPWVSTSVDVIPSEAIVMIHTADPDAVERLADLVFSRHAKQWKLNQITEGEAGAKVLEFTVRLKKRTEVAVVVEAIREAGGASVAQVESIP